MINKLLTLMLVPIFSAYASENLDTDKLAKIAKEREEWTRQHFASEGSPLPDGGVKVMPEQQMAQYSIFKAQRAKERDDINKFGYIKMSMPEIQSLLNFKNISKNQFATASIANPAGDGLRHSIDEIQMAYAFKGVPSSISTNMLGVSPSVTYIEGQGWAGAMQYFETTNLGNCSYRENNLKFSHGSAIIPEEDTSKEVNGKITVSNVTGKVGNGFLYSVDWYDNNFFRELKCAMPAYSSYTLVSALELARQIDNNA